jgi:hypothetical protein
VHAYTSTDNYIHIHIQADTHTSTSDTIHTHTHTHKTACWPFTRKNKVSVLDVVSVEGTAWRRSSTFLQASTVVPEPGRSGPSSGSFLRRTSTTGSYRLPSFSNGPEVPEPPALDIYGTGRNLLGGPNGYMFGQLGEDALNDMLADADSNERCTTWGLKLGHDLIMVMETFCRLNALGFSNLLDHTLESSYKLGLQDASVNSILFTSRPLTAGSTKFWLQAVFFCVSVYYLFCVGLSLHTLVNGTAVWPKSTFRHFRYTNIEARNGSAPLHPGVQEFGLIDADQCAESEAVMLKNSGSSPPISMSLTVGPHIYLSYTYERQLSGWFLRVDPRHVDTKYFEIHASSATYANPLDIPAKEWTHVGTPLWHVTSPIIMDLGLGGEVFTKKRVSLEGRSGLLIFDPRPMWHWVLHRVFRPMLHAVCFFLYSVLGMLRRPVSARIVILTDTVICIAVFLVCGVGYAVLGQFEHAAELFMYIPFCVCMFYGIVFEKTLMSACLVASFVDVFVVVITTYVVYDQPLFTVQSLGLAGLFVWVRMKRWQALNESKRLVRLDQVRVYMCVCACVCLSTHVWVSV